MQEFPAAEQPRHPIQVVVRRTGLSADLLRAWERRYAAVEPGRTSTGRRLYSDRDIERLSQYATGMAAYLAGNYSECVLRLGQWFDGRGAEEESLLEIARAAVSKIDQLAEGDDSERVARQAAALIERIGFGVPAEQLGTGI